MPGPLDYAKQGWNWANKPLVPPSETVDKLAQPGLEDSPGWARVKGFTSGALEGLRGQTSPLNLAGLATLGMGGGAGKAIGEAPEVIQGLSRAIPRAAETLGEHLPEFTAQGGEEMYNLGRQGLGKVADPVEAAYQRIMGTMGPSTPTGASNVVKMPGVARAEQLADIKSITPDEFAGIQSSMGSQQPPPGFADALRRAQGDAAATSARGKFSVVPNAATQGLLKSGR